MKRFLKRLLAALRPHGKRHCSPRLRRVELHVETMEERMVPSTSPLGQIAPLPALPAHLGDSTGGDVATPERAVRGYKWRPPRPWWTQASTPTQGIEAHPDLGIQAPKPTPMQTVSVLLGGVEGRTVTFAAGHVAVTPPQGPLPNAFAGIGA